MCQLLRALMGCLNLAAHLAAPCQTAAIHQWELISAAAKFK
jgi:hypothetical protein